jgi:toxin CcdB
MAQFDIHANLNPQTKKFAPFLIDLQNDYFGSLKTRLVVPLISSKIQRLAPSMLNPSIEVQGKSLWVSVHEMASVPLGTLGPIVSSAEGHRNKILGAVDFLISAV